MVLLRTGKARRCEDTGGIDRDINQPHRLRSSTRQQELTISTMDSTNPHAQHHLLPRGDLALQRLEISADGGESEPEIGNATQVGSCRAMGGERRPPRRRGVVCWVMVVCEVYAIAFGFLARRGGWKGWGAG